MADFRYGFFVRPDNKKIESNPAELKSKAGHISDPKSKPPYLDAGGRQQPIAILPRTRYVTPIEKYTEEVHTKKYEPVKNSDKGTLNSHLAINQRIEFNKLLANVQKEARLPKYEMRLLSEPMTDIGKAIECLKEVVNLDCSKNNACAASARRKDSCTKTIDSKEAARRYGKFGAPVPVSNANVATIDCKEAARKYNGAAV
ncbi:hypothetical protein Csa_019431 [Cucumis sativus]|uniref:Uncharacterized protein n=1 Tax=Cucumis sativus TaxID=3659 RepID=A0A0A0LG87_CUCSA|nr:hypothetical protein Csa_019431 [Cucumis sativus]